MTEMEIKEQICDVCHKMWQLGWVAANDGNVSVKLPDGNFICTPTGISKSFITPEKLAHTIQFFHPYRLPAMSKYSLILPGCTLFSLGCLFGFV